VDEALGDLVRAGLDNGYDIMVLADHGNAEDQTPEWRTSHTTNPVPFILISSDRQLRSVTLRKGRGLADVAPTVLDIFGMDKPAEMSGESLIMR
jgi:2,3-bisphosphoglycerate-independent phosphoglycerate mutase